MTVELFAEMMVVLMVEMRGVSTVRRTVVQMVARKAVWLV